MLDKFCLSARHVVEGRNELLRRKKTWPRVHVDGTACGHRNHRDSRGAAAASTVRRQAESPAHRLPEQSAAVERGLQNVCRRQPGPIGFKLANRLGQLSGEYAFVAMRL